MELGTFFSENPRVALAFSGGVDSAFLLRAALDAGADVTAYYVKSAFQPEFELNDAKRLAAELGAKMRLIDLDVLCDAEITANPANRCYYCKKRIFPAIAEAAGLTATMSSSTAQTHPTMPPIVRVSGRCRSFPCAPLSGNAASPRLRFGI